MRYLTGKKMRIIRNTIEERKESMATGKALDGNQYAGNPHVQFDAGKTAPTATPRRGSLLCRNAVIALAATAAVMSASAAQTLRVVSRAEDKTGDWADAYLSIADAIDAASAGTSANNCDTILVRTGTYNIAETIVANKAFLKIRSVNPDTGEQDRDNTILDGGGTTAIMEASARLDIAGFTFANGYTASETFVAKAAAFTMGTSYCVVSNCVFRDNKSVNTRGTCVCCEYKNRAKLYGCVFTNNTQEITVSGNKVYAQGCAVVLRAGGTVENYAEMSGCLFDDNSSSGLKTAGGIVTAYHAKIEDCTFLTNSVSPTASGETSSGGLVSLEENVTLANCRFSCNGAPSGDGYIVGSVLNVGSSCVVSNCVFDVVKDENATNRKIGTVGIWGDGSQFVGCRFTRVSMSGGSGMIYLYSKNDALFRNCLFADIDKTGGDCTVIRQNKSSGVGVRVENCTFAGDSGRMVYCADESSNYFENSAITGTIRPGNHSVATNCCLVALLNGPNDIGNFTIDSVPGGNLKFADTANGDYHLLRNSPLREKGVIRPWMMDGATDIDGNPRIYAKMPDIGCYECQIPFPGFALFVR